MSGWIAKTSAGTYRAYYRAPDGTTKTKTWKLKRGAEDWLYTEQADIVRGTWSDPAKGKVKFAERFEAYMEIRDPRASTAARYRTHARLYILPAFGHLRLNEITPDHVEHWLTDLRKRGIGDSTIDASLRLLRSVLNHAMRGVGPNPAKGISGPALKPARPRGLEVQEVANLTAAVPDRYQALILTLAYRGLRIGEAAALQVGDIDLLRGRLTVSKALSEVGGHLIQGDPKTDTGNRQISLPAFLRDALTEHLERFSDPRNPEAFVFTSPGGDTLRPNNWRKRVFYSAAQTAGLGEFTKDAAGKRHWDGITPHNLRDTAATLAFAQGATVNQVSAMLGHAKPSITLDRYAAVLQTSDDKMDNALDAAFRAVPGHQGARTGDARRLSVGGRRPS